MNDAYPVRLSVDYPDRELNRLTTAFRIFTVIPIAIVIGTIGGYSAGWGGGASSRTIAVGGTGLLVMPTLPMVATPLVTAAASVPFSSTLISAFWMA